MMISDRIYGDILVENAFIQELITSAPMQRLKGISQDGAVHFIQPVRNVNRFEHCFGAWYLSSLYNRPLEEQAACLLHDVPHTAFSHVVDFVMDDHNQQYHERFLREVIYQSEIPTICKKYHMDVERILSSEKYPLLDNHAPDLSVDRWDYFMRDAYTFQIFPLEMISLILSSVEEKDEKFYFTNLRMAGLFLLFTLQVCQLLYSNPTAHGSYFLLAEALKIALRDRIIEERDFFNNDEYIWNMLKNSSNETIHAYLDRLLPGKEFAYASQVDAEFYGPNKARYVDPLVRHDGVLRRTSDLLPGMHIVIQELKERAKCIGVIQQ